MNLTEQITAGTRKVVTHRFVDLDAVMSVSFYAHLIGATVADLELRFVPSNEQVFSADEVILDLHAPGLKGADSSCFETMLELVYQAGFVGERDYQALLPLAQYVTLEDHDKVYHLERQLRVGTLAELVDSMRGHGDADRDIVLWAEKAFLTELESGRSRFKAQQQLLSAAKYSSGRIVVLLEGAPHGASAVAFDAGAEFVIYQDGNNVGVVRRHDSEVHLGALLNTKLPDGIFAAPQGYIVAWGSRWYPAKSPAPFSATELAEMLEEALG